MPLFGIIDQANNAPKFGAQMLSVGQGPAAQTSNTTALFGNTTANAFVTNQTVGMFAVSATEMNSANNSSERKAINHTGWNLRRVGTGGRSGRITYETIVAGGINSDTSADDTQLPQ